jgi:hypothetical protein
MGKFDREKFNTDPKHEEERSAFDAMVEDSLKRHAAKNQPTKDPAKKEESFIDEFLGAIFGKKD